MIFVSVGSQLPFDRLIKIIDDIAPKIDEELVVQAIPGEYTPKNITLLPKITTNQYNDYVDKARLVVAHAGMGCILTAMLKSKPIIIFPRLIAHGEIRSEHQTTTAKHFEELGQVYVAWDEADMNRLILDNDLESLHTVGPNASPELVSFVENFINSGKNER